MVNNLKIREKMKKYHIPYWKLAYKLGIGESSLYRNMRNELPEYKAKEYDKALDEMIREEYYNDVC